MRHRTYRVLVVQLMQHPLVHHLVHPPVQLLVQSVQTLVQPEVQSLVQRVHDWQGSGRTVVLPVQLCTHVEVQPASHRPAWAAGALPKTEITV